MLSPEKVRLGVRSASARNWGRRMAVPFSAPKVGDQGAWMRP